jgi:hypothetical protein
MIGSCSHHAGYFLLKVAHSRWAGLLLYFSAGASCPRGGAGGGGARPAAGRGAGGLLSPPIC